MIEQILQLMKISDFYGLSEEIEIAKGKHKLETGFRASIKQGKRDVIWQKRKR
jgi:hypothetical protein